MTNSTLQLKFRQRLNKIASNDFDNIECWQIVETFNKAQVEWARRQLRGSNLFQDGDEESRRRIDDLQILLVNNPLAITSSATEDHIYYESTNTLPTNYLEFKRIDVKAVSECCDGKRPMTVYLAEEDNRAPLLRDEHKKPSFEWAETFATLIANKIRIYTNNEFELKDARLTYYRFPVYVQIQGCIDPYTGAASTTNIQCEFKDDIVELIIDEAVAILAGDIESGNQFTRGTEAAERSN